MQNGSRRLFFALAPCASLATLLAVWEGVVYFGIVPDSLLVAPSHILRLFLVKLHSPAPDGSVIYIHAWVSFKEAFLGFLLSLAVGVPLGLAMGWFKWVEGMFRPLFEIIRPIPPVAWIPLTIFWFGIGLPGKVFIIWVGGVVPCVINSYVGVKMTNATLIQMARTYGASDWQIFTTLCVPSALPMVFTALQISLVTCWTNLVGAELLAADSGLGYLITMGGRLARPDIVLLGMTCVGVSGALISYTVAKAEAKLMAGIRR